MKGLACYVCLPTLREDPHFIERLEARYDEVRVHPGPNRPTRKELRDVAENYDVAVCGMAEEFDGSVARSVGRLSLIASLSIGLDHIDVEAFRKEGVTIVNVEDANVVSVAEHTWALILALQKRLFESHRSVLDGSGREGIRERPRDLEEKTVGIVGAGSIGYEVARQAQSFGVDTLVWTFHPDQHPEFQEVGAAFVENLSTLVERSDIVTLHIPLSRQTRELIDTDLLSDIDPQRHRVLVNTARAGIVERAVLDRIGKGGVFDAAGLDVYPSDLPETTSGRIYFTPHTAGVTQEATDRMREEILEKLERAAEG